MFVPTNMTIYHIFHSLVFQVIDEEFKNISVVSWNITAFYDTYMYIALEFNNPELISQQTLVSLII
jgi:hypothetical protein